MFEVELAFWPEKHKSVVVSKFSKSSISLVNSVSAHWIRMEDHLTYSCLFLREALFTPIDGVGRLGGVELVHISPASRSVPTWELLNECSLWKKCCPLNQKKLRSHSSTFSCKHKDITTLCWHCQSDKVIRWRLTEESRLSDCRFLFVQQHFCEISVSAVWLLWLNWKC